MHEYSIVVAVGCVNNYDEDTGELYSVDHAVMAIKKDPDSLFEEIYSRTRDLEELGINILNLTPSIYHIKFNLSLEDEVTAVDVVINPYPPEKLKTL